MGIPKLTGFILHNFHQWSNVDVRDGRLVIDGSSLCYNLYFQHYQWEMGGEYYEFYEIVLEYCRDLQSLRIDAYIVMDGIDFDDSKRASHEKRCKQKFERMADMQSGRGAQERTVHFSLLPLFAKAVFHDAVRDSGLKFFVADGEADQSIVALANHLRCPVVGNDSDFFIFEIEHGYIPITDSRNSLIDLRSSVRCFRLVDFNREFSLQGDQRLFLPLILGNDFHDGCSFPRLSIDSKTPVHKVITNVRQSLRAVEDAGRYGGESALAQMRSIQAYYSVGSQSFAHLSSSQALHASFPSTPSWILDLYKQGKFSPNILHMMLSQSKVWRYLVVVEDMTRPSAWKPAEDALRYIIGLVLGEQDGSAALTDRMELTLRAAPVMLRSGSPQVRSLAEISQLEREERQEILYRVFNCEAASVLINSPEIPVDLKLVVIASHFWLKINRSNSNWVNALVSCVLACFESSLPPRDDRSLLRGQDKLAFIHTFAQWQCILHHVIALNQVLCSPFPTETVSSPRLFSSRAVQYYYRHPSQPSTMAKALLRAIQ